MRAQLTTALRILHRCPNEYHPGFARHWTATGQENCDAVHDPSTQFVSDVDRWSDDSSWLDRSMQEREQQEAEAAVSSYVQQFPSDANEVALNRNGERQLLGLSGWHTIVGLLLTKDVYRLNRCLRGGDSLEGGTGAMMDWNGYASLQQYFDDAMRAFEHLGSSLDLDEPIEAFRGIGLHPAEGWGSFDTWGIRSHLESTDAWEPTVVEDRGFAFASPCEATAQRYNGPHRTDPDWRVICVMEIRRGLCVPDQIYRTPQLMRHLYADSYLRHADGQIIIPPTARWLITSVTPDPETKTVRVRMHQLV